MLFVRVSVLGLSAFRSCCRSSNSDWIRIMEVSGKDIPMEDIKSSKKSKPFQTLKNKLIGGKTGVEAPVERKKTLRQTKWDQIPRKKFSDFAALVSSIPLLELTRELMHSYPEMALLGTKAQITPERTTDDDNKISFQLFKEVHIEFDKVL
jgi:hypothetical protein